MSGSNTSSSLHATRRNRVVPRPGTELRRLLDGVAPVKSSVTIEGRSVPVFTAELWTSKQRQSLSIHEISYRACFKAQLPAFFIERLTQPGDVVYDPFSGRGTTIVQAGLSGRNVIGNDINPLSTLLSRPRFFIPSRQIIDTRLSEIPWSGLHKRDLDLSMFYHPQTESEILSLRGYLSSRRQKQTEDEIDEWIRMVATNRLSGHSKGFFSVYSLPPNQAVTPERQILINRKLNQNPEYRNTRELIVRKSKSLVRNLSPENINSLRIAGQQAMFLNDDARSTGSIPSETVQLTVTSPPFLDIVNYSGDNWLRCWFNEVNDNEIASRITHARTISNWSDVMGKVFIELFRITRPGGWVVFEVGEVRKKSIRLEEYVVPLGTRAGFGCTGILINAQTFTKTSNIWGVTNNTGGTNTNRIVIFQKT